MEKNLPYQTIRPLAPPIRLLRQLRTQLRARAVLFGKKWYYSTNLQAIGFAVNFTQDILHCSFIPTKNLGSRLDKFLETFTFSHMPTSFASG